MDQAERLNRIEAGKLASVAENLIIESIAEQEELVLSKIKALYRRADYNAAAYIGAIGELVALENLVKGLEYVQRQGETAQTKEFGNG